MNLIDKIVSRENLNEAYLQVKRNKGSAGVDKITINEVGSYLKQHKQEIISSILERKYEAQPVRRVYIPKDNGKTRPLGIPTTVDRVIQQAVAQQLTPIYENIFSDFSF